MVADNAAVFTNTTRSRLALAQAQRDRNRDGVLVLRESSSGKTQGVMSNRVSQLRRPASLPPPGGGGRRRAAAPRKPKQMDTQPVEYWNSQAKNYDEKIFSTIDEDTTGVILQSIEKYSSLDEGSAWGRCLDLGCGAGKYLPTLAKRFHSVTACDLSPKLADLARQETDQKGFTNVTVHVRDLSEFWTLKGDPRSSRTQLMSDTAATSDIGCLDFQGYGFAVMANVLIAPVHDCIRMMMLKNAQRCLTQGGHLLAVVPSLESAMYVNMRCQEANYEGPYTTGKQALKHAATAGGPDIFKGILERVGVRTKHFLEAEFVLLANRAGFTIESCEKVSYHWKSELGLDKDEEVPPRLRQPPLPWDWLFVLRNGDIGD